MSAHAELTIRCDNPVCEFPVGHWPVAFWPHTHRELRRLLKTRGWRRTRDGRDFCPTHATPQRRPRAPIPGAAPDPTTRRNP